MTPRSSKHIVYCDECHDLVLPGQKWYQVGGGRIICSICWGDAPEPEREP